MTQWGALWNASSDFAERAELEEQQHFGLLADNPLHLDDVFFAGVQFTGRYLKGSALVFHSNTE